MSRLIERLRRSGQATTQPMGFRAEVTSRRVTGPALIVSVEPADAYPDIDFSDADAVMFRGLKSKLTTASVKKMAEPFGDIPWGALMEDGDDKKTELLTGAGCDFLVLPAESPVSAAPAGEDTGRVFQVEPSLDDGLLRAVNHLPTDAVLVAGIFGDGVPVVWHHLMIIAHVASLVRAPLILALPSGIAEAELKGVWDTGVDGVVLTIDGSNPGEFKELRKMIDALPPRAKRHGPAQVYLPHPGAEPAAVAPPDEEEEEEEDE